MKRFLHNMRERFRSVREGREKTVYDVTTDDTGLRITWLTMENETGVVPVLWSSVTTVMAFKRDQFTVDCICLAFETEGGWVEVNEDMKGWCDCLDAAERYLPGFPPQNDWTSQVMLPAFATNERVLWQRSKIV